MASLHRRVLVALVSFVAGFALVAAPERAEACSASCIDPGYFVPGDGATVPSNLPAIYWRARYDAGGGDVSPANVTLTTTDEPGTPLAFTATQLQDNHYLLVPDAPLVEGTSYRLVDSTACVFGGGVPSPTVTFTVGPSAPLPTTIGTLAVAEPVVGPGSVATAIGSCSLDGILVGAAVSIDYPAVPEAAPWRDVLHFETRVDGQPWNGRSNILGTFAPGASWAGRGVDRLIAVCRIDSTFGDENAASPKLAEGTHQVEMRATLPGTGVSLATGTRAVTLECPSVLPDADAGVDGGNAGDGGDGGGCCSSSADPGLVAGLALALALCLGRRRRA